MTATEKGAAEVAEVAEVTEVTEVAEGATRPGRWRSSSYSNAEGGNCVEVAHRVGGGAVGSVPVRDGKRPKGPALFFGAAAWSSFVAGLRASGVCEASEVCEAGEVRPALIARPARERRSGGR